ncbi:hypothetical protein chiPu_0025266, partial [Chiloscyllium punctatum]|nr:hypothetical protein [Chiloscyllium punctatum]
MRNHRRGRDPGMRRRDHLVARLHLQRAHREVKRVGAVGAGDAVRNFRGRRELALEGVDIAAADEGVIADHAGDRGIDLALDGLVLQLQVGIRHSHRYSPIALLARQQPARRIAGIRTWCRDVLGHDRSGADDDVVGNPDRHDRGVGADRHPVADHGLAPQLLASARRSAGGEGVVDEHHAVPDEAVLADGDELADEGVRLHAGARPDRHALLDFGEGPDEAVV